MDEPRRMNREAILDKIQLRIAKQFVPHEKVIEQRRTELKKRVKKTY